VMVYHSGSNVIGFAFSVANGLENHAYLFGHTWFINATLQMQLSTNGLSIVGLKTGSTAPTTSGTTKMVITDANGQLSFQDSESSLIKGTPTIMAGSGAGSSPTLTVTTNGKQLAISLVVGSSPAGSNATIATINLPTALSYTPFPLLSPSNGSAASLSGATAIYATSSSGNNVNLISGTTSIPSGTYNWTIGL
jgi:hypothetical protein